MSPRTLSNLAVILAGISILGIIAMAFFHPAWGLFNWWPLAGLGLSLSLIVMALVKGASMAAQGRIDMIDTMNDCNVGILRRDDAAEAFQLGENHDIQPH
jgi:hypothetical protein